MNLVFFSSRRRHTRYWRDWSSDVCSSDLWPPPQETVPGPGRRMGFADLLDEQTGIGEGVNHHTQPPPQRVGHLYSLLQPGVRQRGEDAFGDLRVGTLHLIRSEEHTSELQSRQY